MTLQSARNGVKLTVLVLFALLLAAVPLWAEEVANVRDLGAVPDGKTLCTEAIQQAIDRCGSAGGGTVDFPPGTYLSGTVFLKSRVTLRLEAGATLKGSPRLADYPVVKSKVESRTNSYNLRSLIFAEDLDAVSIVGQGTLNGNGTAYKEKAHDGRRPLILRVVNCRDVLVENIHMQNSGFWNQHYLACQRVRVQGIRVFNHATYNVDGIDIDGCRDFVVSDCFIDSDDDAVCLKSTLDRPCENVLISNCVVSSHCNAIKMGTDSSGGFVNVAISNCSIISPRDSKVIYGLQRGISGISLELVDGGRMDRIAISNVTIDGVEVPLFVRLGNRGTGFVLERANSEQAVPIGTLRNVSFANILATHAGKTGCSIVGLPRHCVENVSLNNVTIRSDGGGQRRWAAAAIKEHANAYPEATMFGHLPAHGLYCRHVRGLTFSDVRLLSDKPDQRHALVLDDVQGANLSGLSCSHAAAAPAVVRMTQAENVFIRGCQPVIPDGVFLRLEGRDTAGIALVGNDFSRVGKVAEFGEWVAPTVLRSAGNVEPKP
ncbi:MAG: glycosyl hydrolase family 28-related protein [Thermoguttaceae bacterium]